MTSDRAIAEHNQAELSKLEAKLMYNNNAITLGVVTSRCVAKRTCRNMCMNVILSLTA